MSVNKCKKRRLLAEKTLLNNNFDPCASESAAKNHVDSCQRLIQSRRHDNTLARCQSIRLDNNRSACAANILLRRASVGEAGKRCRRNIGHLTKFFGECFRSLEPRRFFRGSKRRNACCFEIVHNPGDQRCLRTNNHKADMFLSAEGDDVLMISNVQRHICAVLRRAGIARCDKKMIEQRALGQFPGQGVFTSARTDQ